MLDSIGDPFFITMNTNVTKNNTQEIIGQLSPIISCMQPVIPL